MVKNNSKNDNSDSKVQRQRLLWPQVIKVIAIYFVVQVHSAYTPSTSGLTPLDHLGVLGVPLFILLSGALLLGKSEDYIFFFRKRCMKVLFPWIVWTLFYMTFFYYTQHNEILTEFFATKASLFTQWFRFFFRNFMSSLYFLPLIFSIYLLTPLFRIIVKYSSNVDNIYILILWFFIFSIMPYIATGPLFPFWEPTLVYAPIQFSGYFLLGYILIKKQLFKRIHLPYLFLLSIVPFLVLLLPTRTSYIQNFTAGYLFPGTIIAATFAFYFLYTLTNTVEQSLNSFVKKIIVLMGEASFGVYLTNEMFLDYFKSSLIQLPYLYHSEFLLTIFTYIMLTFIVIVIQRIPILKYIMPK